MHTPTLLSAAAILVATATAARNAVDLDSSYDPSQPGARVINRCSYPVYIWSVYKGDGCPTSEMVTLNTGDTYHENYPATTEGSVGISIKISKSNVCSNGDITQLEYYLERNKPGFNNNYLDVSYVNCQNEDCPTRQDGYYLVAGDQQGAATAGAGNTWCPVMSCTDLASCSSMSYVNPDDVQTKTCDLQSSMDFYMCGGEAPSGNYDAAPSAAPSSAAAAPASSASSVAAGSSVTSVQASSSATSMYKANAAAISDGPDIPGIPAGGNIKTEVIFVTKYINARHPHALAHARRHAKFNA